MAGSGRIHVPGPCCYLLFCPKSGKSRMALDHTWLRTWAGVLVDGFIGFQDLLSSIPTVKRMVH